MTETSAMNIGPRQASSEDPGVTCSPAVGRRSFLVATAAIGVSAFATEVPAIAAPAITPVISTPPVSVGYWLGSDNYILAGSSANVETSEIVCSAGSVKAGTAPLNGSARVSVHGLFGYPLSPETTKIDLVIHHYIDENIGTIPVYLWGHQSGPSASQSAPVRCVVPIDHNGGVHLSLLAHGVRDAAEERPMPRTQVHRCSLVNTNCGSMAALRAGVYFIGLGSNAPGSWGAFVFLPDTNEGGSRRLFRRTLIGIKPSAFPYLVISVAPAQGSDNITV